jgi:hypothetical protein
MPSICAKSDPDATVYSSVTLARLVLVGTHIGADGNTIAASEALISALQAEGIVTERFVPQFGDELPMAIMGTWDAKKVAPIRILVSAKP